MRVLLLFRGAPGCGKSTYIDRNGLRPYTLSADEIRLQCQSVQQSIYGGEEISQSNDKTVWKILFDLLELRMENGEFTVIDATNSKTSEMTRYKKLADSYRYRMYCIDMTDLSIDECKRRNAQRPSYKQVPEEVIDKMYARFKYQKIPSGIKMIKPDELDTIWLKQFDMSNYKKIVHIGDVHGCYTALKQYFKDNPFSEDNMYIFVGDLIDRGLENAEVIKFILEIYSKKNVLVLEGNHERWLWIYGNGGISPSEEFERRTRLQLDAAGIDHKEIRKLYRSLGQCAWYKYNDKQVFVSHGGIAKLPTNITKMATIQMIKGVGTYNDFETIADTWDNDTKHLGVYQIHGHRNTKKLPMHIKDRVYNLEGGVEHGGSLRIVELSDEGFNEIEVKNSVFRDVTDDTSNTSEVTNTSSTDYSVSDVVNKMRKNKRSIKEKNFGNISSFNFTRSVFLDKNKWNDRTIKARGLYIDINKMKVAARSYDKFFNVDEMPFTKFNMLQYTMKFPVTAYVKENGFLGLIAYDEYGDYEDNLLITTKSSVDGDYATWLREIFTKEVGKDNLSKVANYCKENDCTIVVECVDIERDPHIIEYDNSGVFLLAVVKNDLNFEQLSYDELVTIGKGLLNIPVKERAYVLNNWQEFYDWYSEIAEDDYKWNGRIIEGFVIEDSVGFMTKIKLNYYKFWKRMRSVADNTLRQGYVTKTSQLYNDVSNDFYGFCQKLYNSVESKEERKSLPRDIITLRRMFYDDKNSND